MNYQQVKDLERSILNTPFGVIQRAINSNNINRANYNAVKFYLSVGAVMLPERTYWTKTGLYFPSRYKVLAGSVGSPQYVRQWFPFLLQEMESELMQLN